MIIQCTSCQARYHYDESRFGGATMKKIKCTKCTKVFEIRNPAAPHSGVGPTFDEFSLDETAMTEARKRTNLPAGVSGASVRPVPAAAAAAGGMSPELEGTGPIGPRVAGTAGRVTVPASARQASQPLRLPTDQRLSLACISGPDSGRIFEIEKPRVVIGRANADIVVSDIQCSRHHAALEVMDEHVFLVDLDSTNGTYVNDLRVDRAELDNRMEFEIGTTTLMLIRSYTREAAGS